MANTGEPLSLVNRSGNRPSSEGAAERFDQARVLCQDAGFRRITFRGDMDFSQTAHLDRWDAAGVRFLFGYDARAFKNLRLTAEAVAEFAYQPIACATPYRLVVVRKNISVEQGAHRLFDEIRYFFSLTNDDETAAADVVFLANDRCHQENLIDQLTHGVVAMRMPVDTLVSNWAYMVMASLAWSLKAWFALRLPETGRWAARDAADKAAVQRMEFKTFINAFMRIPVQVVRTSRRLVFRLLAWNPWQAVFLRGFDQLAAPLRC